MIQRRVKWKKGVTAEKSSMQAGRGLGNSRRAGEGCVCVCVHTRARVFRVLEGTGRFEARRGNTVPGLRAGAGVRSTSTQSAAAS